MRLRVTGGFFAGMSIFDLLFGKPLWLQVPRKMSTTGVAAGVPIFGLDGLDKARQANSEAAMESCWCRWDL